MDLVVNNNISLFFVTETWLTDMNNHTTASIKSYGFHIHHCFRHQNAGGGVAIIFKPTCKVVKIFHNHANSFESVSVKLKLQDSTSLICTCIYRTGNMGNFINDLDDFIGDLFVRFENFLICGDVNIQLDVNSGHTNAFINTISSYGLHQHISEATHRAGHILDVVISSHKIVKDDCVIVDSDTSRNFPTCDHYPLLFDLSCGVDTGSEKKTIVFRNLKAIDKNEFEADIKLTLDSLCPTSKSFSDCITFFNSSCTTVLNNHAPEMTKVIRDIPTAPWFDSEYKNARRERRKAEQKWRKSQLEIDRDIFVHLRLHCNELAKLKKAEFFKSRFEKHSYSQKSLYQFVDMFLDHSSNLTLPPADSLQNIVDQFNKFFLEKIEKIRENFPESDSSAEPDSSNEVPKFTKLTDFEPTTIDEIREVLKESDIKTSTNDPLPALVVKENIDTLLPHICDLVNLSLSSGSIDGAKLAHLTPLIKGQSLDSSKLKNYRPISNLSFIGKLIERIVLKRLNVHLDANKLNISNQSAYKKLHSCETLMVRIVNDLLIASDEEKATVVMLLDLSAAFDTVDHTKLLSILKHEIGLEGNALSWFKSFLCGRCQKVRIGDCESVEIIIKFGVPQGSVLGPVLFNIYVRSLYNTVQALKFAVHGFADDHQICKPFSPEKQHGILACELPRCFQEITNWMNKHYLQLNPGKTEVIVFGTPSVLHKIKIHGTFINPSICIRFVSSVKNLGIYLDSGITFCNQVKNLKQSCFHKLRNIAKMKSFLTIKQMTILTQALVVSALDYCNALYYGIDTVFINQLQVCQNRACRVIFGLKKRDSVTQHLQSLHWLRIRERVDFKVLLLVYKCLNGLAPEYLAELLQYNNLSGSRCPTLKSSVTATHRGARAFQASAPLLWNSLPVELRQSPNVNNFKCTLKTFLFKRSYSL